MTGPRWNLAAWILSLAVEPARARELAAELLEANGARSPAAFWAAVIRTTIVTSVREIGRAPWTMAWLVLTAYVVSALLGLAFVSAPPWLALRYTVAPFLLGALIAGFARGRTLATFEAVMISEIALDIISQEYAVHLGAYRLAEILVYVPRDFVFVLMGAIAVRVWTLRHAPV